MLLTMVGSVCADDNTKPIPLKGGSSGVIIEPIAPSTLGLEGDPKENLFAAKYTVTKNQTNVFQLKDLDVSGYAKLVIKFGSDQVGRWAVWDGGYRDSDNWEVFETDCSGKDKIDEVTVFNNENPVAEGTSITITGMYLETADGDQTPLALKGGKDDVTIEPIAPSTLLEGDPKDNLFAASFTATGQLQNMFQYKPLDATEEVEEGYQKIVLEFDGKAPADWYIHAYGNSNEPFYALEGLEKYELELTGSVVQDLTIFNLWAIPSEPITVTSCYFSKSPATFTVGSAGWATCGSAKPVGYSGDVVAYTAKYEDGRLLLTEVTTVPQNTAVIVKAAAGEYEYSYEESAESVDNDLKISNGRVESNGNIYVLANGDNGIGFYLLANGVKVPTGKAYLEVNAAGREFIGFDGEATAIKSVENVKANGAVYNLAGQQVKNAQKGVFIVNGKKVIK